MEKKSYDLDLRWQQTKWYGHEILKVCSQKSENIIDVLRTLRLKCSHNAVTDHYVNSIRNKFETLVSLAFPDKDISANSETKVNQSLSLSQFLIDSFSMP